MPTRGAARESWEREFAFIDSLEGLSSVDEVTTALEHALARFGIERFIVAGLPTRGQPFEELVVASRWPAAFFVLYMENDYARFDPLCHLSIQSSMPFEWSADSWRSSADARAAEVMGHAADHGLRHGYLVPIHGPGSDEAFVSMAAAELDLSPHAKSAIHLMTLYAYDRMRRLRGELPLRKSPLTAREREVLTLTARGKSAAQISKALEITQRTVNEHTQTATHKLGATNRTQAVAIAMRDRVIEF